MTAGDPAVQLLADHSVWLAVPAFAPAFVVAGVVVYIAAKNKQRGDGPHSEPSGPADKDR